MPAAEPLTDTQRVAGDLYTLPGMNRFSSKPDFSGSRVRILIGHDVKRPEIADRVIEGLALVGITIDWPLPATGRR